MTKFRENETFKCLVQPVTDDVMHSDHPLKGHWGDTFFGNDKPIVLELGCGKGEYTIDLALRDPSRNYIGVDIKGARLWKGAKYATAHALGNVGFLRTRIEFINSLFAPGEVSEIWITFADPQVKKPKKRLTSPLFIERYRKIMRGGGIIHLKTDSLVLHDYSEQTARQYGFEILACATDIYGADRQSLYHSRFAQVCGRDAVDSLFEVQTFYESQFLAQGIPITFLSFRIMENIYSERISRVREMMRDNGWDAVVFTSSDPHTSEYPAPRWQVVNWVSGFTGEAGDVVITADHAGLWTDSRYFIQAGKQLQGTGVELHKTGLPDSVDIAHWLRERASVVALDGLCASVAFVQNLVDVVGCEVVDVPDLVDSLWSGRPHIPVSPVITLGTDTVGESRQDKLTWLRKFLLTNQCDSILLSSLDEIAWLLNVRGSDIDYNPFVISYLYVSQDKVLWCVEKDPFAPRDEETTCSYEELEADGVTVCGYDNVFVLLAQVSEAGDKRIFVDYATLNYNLYTFVLQTFGKDGVVGGASPVPLRKAVKNSTEIACMREAYFVDGLAMEKFLYWLENRILYGDEVDEWEASEKLTSLRAEIPGYRGNSFENISAYMANAALPHYSTPEEGSAKIEPRGLYLVDCGGHYLFGSTDITRTVPMGECSALEREDYTLVLKGMIQLAMAVFPRGTAGCQLDVLARNPLWRSKRNFGHGTGHGIGFYLGVHEGPQSIRQNFNTCPILPGMVTSNEPGIYREGQHGVRHECIVLCVESGKNSFGDWLEFETLTLCHIDTSAIVRELMTDEEIRWLNDYNATVYERLAPHLPADIATWLRFKTTPMV